MILTIRPLFTNILILPFLWLHLLCLVNLPGTNGWRRDLVQPNGFILTSNYFGLNLLDQLTKENERNQQKENIFFSPYSVSIALAMLHQGSVGQTSHQLETTLGYQLAKLNGNKSLVSWQIRKFTQELISEDSNSTSFVLRTGNALITDQKFAILDSYKKNLNQNFYANLFSADFITSGEDVQKLINDWCFNQTNGKISMLLTKPPSPDTKMALLNAIYFKGIWKLKFDPNQTEEGIFYGINGEKFEHVPFMKAKDYFNVGNLAEIDADLVELQYEGEELSFYAILPREKNSELKLIKKALNPWYVEAAISRSYSQEIELKLPKLDLKKNYQLVDSLKALGIEDVFGQKSNLSALSTEPNLAVDEVKHVASIEVNEEGSEAAASTYIGIVRLSLQLNTPVYAFDHPFLFFIRQNKNGQILFIGEINGF